MRDEMTIEDATNVVNVLSDVLACDANEDVRELATAARQLVRHIAEQSSELERERARRRSLARGEVRVPDGNPLKEGTDGGGRRDFLAGAPCTRWRTASPPDVCRLASRAKRVQLPSQRASAVSAAAWGAAGRGDRRSP